MSVILALFGAVLAFMFLIKPIALFVMLYPKVRKEEKFKNVVIASFVICATAPCVEMWFDHDNYDSKLKVVNRILWPLCQWDLK